MRDIWQNLQFAVRTARKAPAVSCMAILALAIGIGANTAVFGLANAAFFRPLPYPNANRLAFLWQTNGRTGEVEGRVSYPNYADWRAQSTSFEDMAFFMSGASIFGGAGDPERVPGALVSTNFFSVMGVHPAIGRGFTADDQLSGHTNVVVISDNLWRTRFGSDPNVLGRNITFGNDHDTIIGVMPPSFAFPNDAQLWTPRVVNEFLQTKSRQYPIFEVIGRLKGEATLTQAQTELDTIAKRLAESYPSIDGGVLVRLVPLREQLSEKVREGVLLLWGAILGILLISCLNVANLIVARASHRQREIAIRLSLGASQGRILKQFLAESLVLASAGAVLGVGLASLIVNFVSTLNPEVAKLGGSILDIRVLAYTIAVTGFTVLICGILPSVSLSRMDLNESLKKASSGTAPRSTQRIRSAFICAEVSLAFVLLVGSGLLVRSLWQIFAVDPGVDAGHVLSLHVYWPNAPSNAADNEKRNALFEELMTRLRGLAGVTSVAATSNVLFPNEIYKVPFLIEDQAAPASGERPFLPHDEATPDYFRTMGIPLLKGRFFDQNDALKTAVPVAIINETMARRYWQGSDPLGKRFRLDDPNFKSPWFTIVGVVGNVRQQGLEKSPGLMAYMASSGDWGNDLAVRTKMDPRTLVNAIREQVRSLDKNLAVDHVHSVSDLLASHESQRKFNALLLGGLALVALLLAAVGIYGTISYWVRQRTREIGVRMALGARRVHIFELVMRQGLFLVVVGLCFGIGAGLAAARLIASLLYGVSAYDPITFAAIAVLVVVVAFVACYLPALRAVKVDPLEALRYE